MSIEAPAVVHGQSEKSQSDWFHECAATFKRQGCSGKVGKGHHRREYNSKKYGSEYDRIFRKDNQ